MSEQIENIRKGTNYVDPTMSLPVPPPKSCKNHVNQEVDDNCPSCATLLEWNKNYGNTINDLLLWSNMHSCNRGTKKDGTRKKGKAYANCMDNEYGKCKAQFPQPTAPISSIDETGAITMKSGSHG